MVFLRSRLERPADLRTGGPTFDEHGEIQPWPSLQSIQPPARPSGPSFRSIAPRSRQNFPGLSTQFCETDIISHSSPQCCPRNQQGQLASFTWLTLARYGYLYGVDFPGNRARKTARLVFEVNCSVPRLAQHFYYVSGEQHA